MPYTVSDRATRFACTESLIGLSLLCALCALASGCGDSKNPAGVPATDGGGDHPAADGGKLPMSAADGGDAAQSDERDASQPELDASAPDLDASTGGEDAGPVTSTVCTGSLKEPSDWVQSVVVGVDRPTGMLSINDQDYTYAWIAPDKTNGGFALMQCTLPNCSMSTSPSITGLRAPSALATDQQTLAWIDSERNLKVEQITYFDGAGTYVSEATGSPFDLGARKHARWPSMTNGLIYWVEQPDTKSMRVRACLSTGCSKGYPVTVLTAPASSPLLTATLTGLTADDTALYLSDDMGHLYRAKLKSAEVADATSISKIASLGCIGTGVLRSDRFGLYAISGGGDVIRCNKDGTGCITLISLPDRPVGIATPTWSGSSGAHGIDITSAGTISKGVVQASTGTLRSLVLESALTWGSVLGGRLDERATSVAFDKTNKHIVVSGLVQSSIAFTSDMTLKSAGGDNCFVAGFDAASKPLWHKVFGAANHVCAQDGSDLAAGSAGATYLGAKISGTVALDKFSLPPAAADTTGVDVDVLVAKLDANGKTTWAKRFGAAGVDTITGVAVDSSDNVVVSGWTSAGIDFGDGMIGVAGGSDAFVASFTKDGALSWATSFGGTGDDKALSVAIDSVGAVYIGGEFHGTVNFGGQALVSAGGSDAFMVKLDSSGQHVWSFASGEASDDRTTAVAVNDIYAYAALDYVEDNPPDAANGQDVYTYVINSSTGVVGEASYLRYHGTQTVRALHTDGSTGLYMVGQMAEGFPIGPVTTLASKPGVDDPDGFVAHLTVQLGVIWSRDIGGPGAQNALDVAADADGFAIAVGASSGKVDLGLGPLASKAKQDLFMARYTP